MIPMILAQAPQPDPLTVWDLISQGGVVGLLALIVVGAWREWWFTSSAYHRLETEKDEWKELALRSLQATDKAVTLVERP